jgi:hypothetical protein
LDFLDEFEAKSDLPLLFPLFALHAAILVLVDAVVGTVNGDMSV